MELRVIQMGTFIFLKIHATESEKSTFPRESFQQWQELERVDTLHLKMGLQQPRPCFNLPLLWVVIRLGVFILPILETIESGKLHPVE
jgi:hypothetical protein